MSGFRIYDSRSRVDKGLSGFRIGAPRFRASRL